MSGLAWSEGLAARGLVAAHQTLYVPHQHLCINFQTSEVGYIAGTPYVGATVDMLGPWSG